MNRRAGPTSRRARAVACPADPANAAALRDAVTAIDSRYNALGEIDDRRIKSAQAALDDWDRAPAGK